MPKDPVITTDVKSIPFDQNQNPDANEEERTKPKLGDSGGDAGLIVSNLNPQSSNDNDGGICCFCCDSGDTGGCGDGCRDGDCGGDYGDGGGCGDFGGGDYGGGDCGGGDGGGGGGGCD